MATYHRLLGRPIMRTSQSSGSRCYRPPRPRSFRPSVPAQWRVEPLPAQGGRLCCAGQARPRGAQGRPEGQRVGSQYPAAFRQDPGSFLLPEIEASGGTGDVMCGGTVLRRTSKPNTAAGTRGSRVGGQSLLLQDPGQPAVVPPRGWWEPVKSSRPYRYPGAAQPLVLPRTQVDEVISKVERAKLEGHGTFQHGGQTYPVEKPDDLLNVLRGLTGLMAPEGGPTGGPPPTVPQRGAGWSAGCRERGGFEILGRAPRSGRAPRGRQ